MILVHVDLVRNIRNVMANNRLNIIDESGKIVGQESRDVIHQKGLLHREIHVLFYTPEGEMIFQHRGKDKDTYPDLLDATVGGHVEIGNSPIETAIKETKEETGFSILENDLEFIKFIKHKSFDKVTARINNAVKAEYAYCYRGNINKLKIEKGKALGFEAWPIKKLLNISSAGKKKFISFLFEKDFMEIINILDEKSKNCHVK